VRQIGRLESSGVELAGAKYMRIFNVTGIKDEHGVAILKIPSYFEGKMTTLLVLISKHGLM